MASSRSLDSRSVDYYRTIDLGIAVDNGERRKMGWYWEAAYFLASPSWDRSQQRDQKTLVPTVDQLVHQEAPTKTMRH